MVVGDSGKAGVESEINIAGRPGGSNRQFQSMSTLENPSVDPIVLYASDKSVKGNLLSQALQILTMIQSPFPEPVLKGLANMGV